MRAYTLGVPGPRPFGAPALQGRRPFSMVIRFSVFEVDPTEGTLRKRGVRVRLGGRPVQFLLLLLERQGQIVGREELRQRLWPADTFVDFDHALNTLVNRLREVLGDSATTPRFIETLPRRGYRFVAPVEIVGPPGAPSADASPGLVGAPAGPDDSTKPVADSAPPRGRPAVERYWTAAALVGLLGLAVVVLAAVLWQRGLSARPMTGKLMLAVLPFERVGEGPDDRVLSDGLTQELIGALGGLDPARLGVIARTTVMQYRQTPKPASEIGRELSVDYLLEGTVQVVGQRVRVAAQLVETTSQDLTWTRTYEQSLDDVLMLQRDVAADVARALALRILPVSTAGHAPAPVPFEAYEAFLRGRYFREQSTVSGARRAIASFERATSIDPTFARAWAGQAEAYRLLAAPGLEAEPPVVLSRRAMALAERALALAPDLAEAQVALAMLQFSHDWDLAGAEQRLRRAIEANPNLAQAHQFLSAVLTTQGRFEEAIAAAERARVLDPLSATVTTTLAIRHLYARRYSDALAHLEATLDVTPEFAPAHWAMGVVRREMGDGTGAVLAMRRAVEHSGGSSYMRAWLAHTLATTGQTAEARRIEAALAAEARTSYVSPFNFALMALGLGDRARAMDWLERCYQDRSGWMVFLPVQREFEPLAADPRYRALLQRVRERRVSAAGPGMPPLALEATTRLPASRPGR